MKGRTTQAFSCQPTVPTCTVHRLNCNYQQDKLSDNGPGSFLICGAVGLFVARTHQIGP